MVFTADSSSLLAADRNSGIVHRYNLLSGKESKPLAYAYEQNQLLSLTPDTVNAITNALSPDGQHYLTNGPTPSSLIVRELGTNKIVYEIQGHVGKIENYVYSPDGKRILTASYDRTVRIWNTLNGHELAVLKGQKGDTYWLAISGNGRQIATGGPDDPVRVWIAAPHPDASPLPKERNQAHADLQCADSLAQELERADGQDAPQVSDPKFRFRR